MSFSLHDKVGKQDYLVLAITLPKNSPSKVVRRLKKCIFFVNLTKEIFKYEKKNSRVIRNFQIELFFGIKIFIIGIYFPYIFSSKQPPKKLSIKFIFHRIKTKK